MMRVYLNGKLRREEPGRWELDALNLDDRGRMVLGVEIPAGHEVMHVTPTVGRYVLRVDIRTRAKE